MVAVVVSPSARLLPVRCAPLVCGWVVAVMWSPLPVCLVWIHRRGCSLDVGWCGRLGDVAAGWLVWFVVVWLVRGDWSPWVRCSLSDVRRWCVAGLWLVRGCDVAAVAGVPGMDPPARLLPRCGLVAAVDWWPWVGCNGAPVLLPALPGFSNT